MVQLYLAWANFHIAHFKKLGDLCNVVKVSPYRIFR